MSSSVRAMMAEEVTVEKLIKNRKGKNDWVPGVGPERMTAKQREMYERADRVYFDPGSGALRFLMPNGEVEDSLLVGWKERLSLREAGYREQVYVKAYLAICDRMDEWPEALDLWEYDAHLDVLNDVTRRLRVKVRMEGSTSCEELRKLGLDDSDVPAKNPPPDAAPASYIETRGPSDADLEYLDDLASAYLAAPEMSDEEDLLDRAHSLACERIGLEPVAHVERAEAVKKLPREPQPYVVRLALALLDVLVPGFEGWLREEPWAEVEITLSDYLSCQVFHAVARAYSRVGGSSPSLDPIMVQTLTAELLARHVEDGIQLRSLNDVELHARVEKAVALVADSAAE